MGIVVLGAVFVDVKGYPLSTYIPGGRNVGRVEQAPRRRIPQRGGGHRQCGEPRPPSSVWWTDTGMGEDVVRQLRNHKVNTDYILRTPDGMGAAGGIRQPLRRVRLHLQAAGFAAAGGTAGREG